MNSSRGIFYFESFLILMTLLSGRTLVEWGHKSPIFPTWAFTKIDSPSSTLLLRRSQYYQGPGGKYESSGVSNEKESKRV